MKKEPKHIPCILTISNHEPHNRNILLAPNSFKGSLDAFEFCRILATELEECGFHTISLPLGDGGDGTARIVAHYLHAHPIKTKTVDALGREHFASYYLKDSTAIIELAEACGLKHLKREEQFDSVCWRKCQRGWRNRGSARNGIDNCQ